MKRSASRPDPLEETMENPDLPPLAAVPESRVHPVATPGRRSLRVMLLLAAFLVVGVFVARFVA